jgi:hypothetical protein
MSRTSISSFKVLAVRPLAPVLVQLVTCAALAACGSATPADAPLAQASPAAAAPAPAPLVPAARPSEPRPTGPIDLETAIKLGPRKLTPDDLAKAAALVGDAPLDGGERSVEALAKAVVAALDASDGDVLVDLAVNEAEYTQRLWRAMAKTPNAVGLGPENLWKMSAAESFGDLKQLLERYGELDFELVSVEIPREETLPGNLRLHRDPIITLKFTDGRVQVVPLIRIILEHEPTKVFKVLMYGDH